MPVPLAGLLGDEPVWAETLWQQVAYLRAGDHVCPIYATRDEQLRAVVPFLQAALGSRQQGLLFADGSTAEAVLEALQEAGVDANAELRRGALRLVTSREAFVRNDHFDPDAMLAFQRTTAEQATDRGFVRLRIVSEMKWVLGPDIGRQAFFEFEHRLNDFTSASGTIVICQYERRSTSAAVIHEVLRTHPLAVIGDHLHDNPYFDPVALAGDGSDVERQRVDWMLGHLESRTRRETATWDLGRLALAGAPVEQLMQAAAQWIAAEMHLAFVQIFQLDSSGKSIRLVASTGLHEAITGAIEPVTSDSPLASEVLRRGLPLIIPDWAQEERFQQPHVLREAGITSSTSVMISIGLGQYQHGILSVHCAEHRMFTEDEVLFLQTVATLLAHVMSRLRSEESFRALVENDPDLIARFDQQLRIAYANSAFERFTGRLAESLIGKTSQAVGMPESVARGWELVLRQAWRTGREQTAEFTLSTAGGDRHFQARIVPEFGPDGSVQSLLTVSRDVTDLRQSEMERGRLIQELVAQQDRMQDLVSRVVNAQGQTRRGPNHAAETANLSDREREILRLLAAGRTNRVIGAQVGLSAGTVKNYVAQILAKLHATDRTQAAVRAVELGLLDAG